MLKFACRPKTFIFLSANLKYGNEHLFAGTLMGIGASLAVGENSIQVLLAVPIFSRAGFGVIGGIILGLRLGLFFNKHYQY